VSHTETILEAELVVGGMTCGACAARIERRLNRLDGVAATVNYATGRAYFSSLGGRDARELIGVIESAGYAAKLPVPPDDRHADVVRLHVRAGQAGTQMRRRKFPRRKGVAAGVVTQTRAARNRLPRPVHCPARGHRV